MESSRSEDFFGVLVEKIGLTIWCPDFCDGHRTELCSIAETLSYVIIKKFYGSETKGSAPTPHKGGNTVELPPWKKGWHRPVAPQYARPDFMRCRSPPGTGLWPHNMWGPTLCGAAPPFRLHCSRYQVWGGAAPHIPRSRIFQGHGPVPPPFPWRYILCAFSMLNCHHQ